MPSNKIGALSVDLSLETQNFLNGLKDAQKETDATAKAFKPLTTAFKDLGESMSVVGDVTAGAMAEAALKAAEYGAQLQHLSERSGATIQDLAGLGFAATQNGSSLDGLGNSLKFLSKNMELAQTGAGAQQHAFEALGITQADLNATGGSSSAMFALLADRVAGMADPWQHASDLTKILGRSWTELLPTLELGSAGLKNAADQAQRLGLVISDEAAEADLKFEQSLKQVEDAAQGLANSIGSALIPQFTSALETFRNVEVSAGNLISEHQGLTKAAFDVAAAIGGTGGVVLALAAIGTVAPKVAGGFELISGAAAAAGLTLASAATLVPWLALAAELIYVESLVSDINASNKDRLAIEEQGVRDTLKTRDALASVGIMVDQGEKSWAEYAQQINQTAIFFKDSLPGAANAAKIAWNQTAVEIAAAQKKIREDASKANDDYYTELAKSAKDQRALGRISADDLLSDLNFYEANRFAATDLADGNVQSLTQKHLDALKENQNNYNKDIAALAQAQQAHDQSDIQQANSEQIKAANELINAQIAIANDEYNLGLESGAALRAQLENLENDRYQIIIDSGKQTEATWQDHVNKLLAIDTKFASDDFATDSALQGAKALLNQVDVSNQAASQSQQLASADATGKAILKEFTANAKIQGELGKQVAQEWSSAMNQLDKSVSSAFADMALNGKLSWGNLTDSFLSITQNTAKSLLTAMEDGFIKPLTDRLAKLGTSFTDSLLGITKAGTPGTSPGGAITSIGTSAVGSAIGSAFNGAGQSAATTAAFNATNGIAGSGAIGGSGNPGSGGGSGGGMSSLASGFLNAGLGVAIDLGVGEIVKLYKNMAHFKADDLVKNFQQPFDKQFASIITAVTTALNDGDLQQGDAQQADNDMYSLWKNVSSGVDSWAVGDSGKEKVAGQFHATEDSFVQNWLNWIDGITIGLGGKKGSLLSFGTGIDVMPFDAIAQVHKGEMIIPAASNPANQVFGGGWTGAGMNQQADQSIRVEATFNVEQGAVCDEMWFRSTGIPMLINYIKNNTGGFSAAIQKKMHAMGIPAAR